MRIKLAPSLARADTLNLESELRRLEKAKVDLIHIDITDTTYSDTIWLSPEILPAVHKVTGLPLDVHLLVGDPERLFPSILPCCRGDYVCVQLETVRDAARLLTLIRNAGCIPALAVGVGTPLSALEELLPYFDMVNLIVRCIGCPAQALSRQMLDKIGRMRRMLDEGGRPEAEIEVDGSIDYTDSLLTVERGANILVLGTKVVFRPGHSYLENCDELRRELDRQGKEAGD